MKPKQPKTQRAWAAWQPWGDIACVHGKSEDFASHAEPQPILVVPEEAVRGCRHEDVCMGEAGTETWCRNCGAWKDLRYDGGRWQRPRVLRVAR